LHIIVITQNEHLNNLAVRQCSKDNANYAQPFQTNYELMLGMK